MTQTTEVATTDNTLLRLLKTPAMQDSLQAALPAGGLDVERFTRIVMTECRKTPKLLECDQASFLGSILKAAAMGLEIGVLGQANLVPYGKECTLIVGYQGQLALLYNTGEVGSVSSEIIYSVDDFEYALGETPHLAHVPPKLGTPEYDQRTKDTAIGAYSVITLKDGQKFIKVMSEQEILRHKARSKTPKIWNHPDDWAWMWKKTTIIQCAKLAPKSVTKHVDAARVAEWDPKAMIDSIPTPAIEQDDGVIDVEANAAEDAEPEPEATNPPEAENATATPDEARKDTEKPPRKGEVTPENAHLQR